MLYCNFIEINNRWICTQCGTEINISQVSNKPFGLCRIHINNKDLTQTVLEKRATPFGIADKTYDIKIPQDGPGTELKKILLSIGILSNSKCSCNKRAEQMNVWGCDKCIQNIEKIVDWLQQEASKRRIIFFRFMGKLLVYLAVKRARKKLNSASRP